MPRPNTGPRLKFLKERGIYYIIWYERGAKNVKSTRTADKSEAEEAFLRFLNGMRAEAGPQEPDEITVADALAYYGEHHGPTVASPQRLGELIDALLSYWDGKLLTDITPTSCKAYAKHRGCKPGTIRRELGVLVTAQNYMVRERLLKTTVPVELPPKPEPKDRWLTRDEFAKLLNQSRQMGRETRTYLPLFMLIAFYMGARKEQITSLRWNQVDLKNRRINFAIEGRRVTKKKRPHLPIPNRLYRFLQYAWQRRSADDGPVLHIRGKAIKRVDKGFRLAARKVGLDDVSPHTLRHTRGTLLAQAGMSMWKIAGWLGQDPATTAKIYTHHSPDFMDDVLKSVDAR